MFIRKKKNRSGTTSIVVVDKRNGIYREIITICTSNNSFERSSLFQGGEKMDIPSYWGTDVFDIHERAIEEKQVTEYLISNIENILLNKHRSIAQLFDDNF